MLKQFILRELDSIKNDAAAGRAESSKDHDEVKASIAAVDGKLDDVRTRVTVLEENGNARARTLLTIKWLTGIIAGAAVALFTSGQLS